MPQPTPVVVRTGSGLQRQPTPGVARTGSGLQRQPTLKKNVLCVFHNDLVDSDNLTSAIVWAKMVQAAQAEHDEGVVKSFFVFEPHRVDFGMRRIKGTDVPFILIPMCRALFTRSEGVSLVERHKAVIKKYAQTHNYKTFDADLKKVLDRHEVNFVSTIVRADLTMGLVKAIVNSETPIMSVLRGLKYTTNETVDNAWIETQLSKCVPSVDPPTWKEDSILAAKLVIQDFWKTIRGLGLIDQNEPFYLDEHVLDRLQAPLCRRMEHPEWLVNYKKLVEKYEEVMDDLTLNRATIHEKVKDLVKDELKAKDNRQDKIHTISRDYTEIINAGQQAERIFFFGGSSMSILDRLLSAGLGPKIDFVGQGGTKDPKQNLTGNTFNWDLNPSAAYRVLLKQAKGPGRTRSWQIGTTELGKLGVTFSGEDLTNIAGNTQEARHKLGRRIATYGLPANRTNPEKVILAPAKYAEQFRNAKNETVPINCPDLAALFAAYAPKLFRDKHSFKYHPTQMFIRLKSGTPVGVERVKFAIGLATIKPDQLVPIKEGDMTLWMPNPHSKGMVTGTAAIADECATELKNKVEAVLNPPQAGTAASGSPATGPAGDSPTANRGPTMPSAPSGTPRSRKPTGLEGRPGPGQSGNGAPPPGTIRSVSSSTGQPRTGTTGTPRSASAGMSQAGVTSTASAAAVTRKLPLGTPSQGGDATQHMPGSRQPGNGAPPSGTTRPVPTGTGQPVVSSTANTGPGAQRPSGGPTSQSGDAPPRRPGPNAGNGTPQGGPRGPPPPAVSNNPNAPAAPRPGNRNPGPRPNNQAPGST